MEDIVSEDIETIVKDIKSFVQVLEGKNILIAGGMGFIGIYFVKVFSKLNEILGGSMRITVLDNLITAKNRGEYNEKKIKFVQQDISKPFDFSENLDYIIHAASIASPPVYRKFPLKTVDVNYQGTRNLLEIAREKKVRSMLFLSSSEIYGDPTIIPTPESYWGHVSSIGPRACYDESKRLGETVSILYYQEFGVPVKIVRPFNVYGPFLNLEDGRMIPDFMKHTIENSEIIIHSDGTPTRSFCYITDAMRAFFRILLLAPPCSILNVGNDKEISVKNVAEIIKKISNKPIKIKFEKSIDPNYTKDNPSRRCPDLNQIQTLVDFHPVMGLEDGLKRLYAWYLRDRA